MCAGPTSGLNILRSTVIISSTPGPFHLINIDEGNVNGRKPNILKPCVWIVCFDKSLFECSVF